MSAAFRRFSLLLPTVGIFLLWRAEMWVYQALGVNWVTHWIWALPLGGAAFFGWAYWLRKGTPNLKEFMSAMLVWGCYSALILGKVAEFYFHPWTSMVFPDFRWIAGALWVLSGITLY